MKTVKFLLLLVTILLSQSILSQQAFNLGDIEMTVQKAYTSTNAQTFVTDATVENGSLVWVKQDFKPFEFSEPGVVFGIIEYKIVNKSRNEVKIHAQDFVVKVNDEKRHVVCGGNDESEGIFNQKYSSTMLSAGADLSQKIIFTSPEPLEKASLKIGNRRTEINVNFSESLDDTTSKSLGIKEPQQTFSQSQPLYVEKENVFQPVKGLTKMFVGVGIGPAYPLGEMMRNSSGLGLQMNMNFGYLMKENFGIAATAFLTSFELKDQDATVGLSGAMVGPLFMSASPSGKFEWDFKPMIGYANGNASIGDKVGRLEGGGTFILGLCPALRWNKGESWSLNFGIDAIYGKIGQLNLSSLGGTIGVNLQF